MWKKLRSRLTASPDVLPSQTAYALWAANYPATAHNALMQAEEAAMQALMPSLAGKRVLDLACGSGRYAHIAATQNAVQCIAIDNSVAMLNAADGQAGIIFAQGDTRRIPLRAGSMDVVLCGLAIGHVPQVDDPLREIARVLRPGGVALVSDFHPFLFLDGKQRTFAAPDGKVYAVEHYAHLYSDVHTATTAHRLTITQIAEPRLTIDGRDLPAVIVYRMQRENS